MFNQWIQIIRKYVSMCIWKNNSHVFDFLDVYKNIQWVWKTRDVKPYILNMYHILMLSMYDIIPDVYETCKTCMKKWDMRLKKYPTKEKKKKENQCKNGEKKPS